MRRDIMQIGTQTYWPTEVLKSSKLKLLQDAILTNHVNLKIMPGYQSTINHYIS
jgi:hypothetical protein